MPFVLITPPTTEPLSLEEAKLHLRLEEPVLEAENVYVGGLVAAARRHVEKVTGRALVTQTWEAVEDGFPCAELRLAKGELQSVTSVKYLDAAGAEQTLDAAAYQVDAVRRPGRLGGRVVLAPGAAWPATAAGRINAVRVRFVAGYGAASAVPDDIKQAMRLLIGHLYEHREEEITGTITSRFAIAKDALLTPYMLHGS